jgi:hypothetical protein
VNLTRLRRRALEQSEGEMSPRKPTIDDLDDIDDEDGVLEEEMAEETDLTLHDEGEDAAALGGTGDAADEATEGEEEPEED